MSAEEYARRAQLHRPADQASLAREAHRLAAQGLRAVDIAVALGLTPAAVEELLEVRRAA